MAKHPKVAKLVANPQLREYVQDRLSGALRGPDGAVVAGPGGAGLEGAEQAAPPGPALVDSLGPTTDLAPAAPGVPR